jgi:pimeloyl-ACP methyl ester carboxylesterase
MWRFKSSPPHQIMKQPLHLIYIPGLGDTRIEWQRRAVGIWHRWGVEAELFEVNWTDNEPWDDKLGRLIARIDELKAAGKKVGLVGASAGAAVAVTAFAARKDFLTGAVCIAGKVNRPETVNPDRYRTNPAFEQAIHDCQAAIKGLGQADRKRILSRFAIFDEVVTKSDSRIVGARNRLVPTIEHVLTIAEQITLGAPGFIRFLKRHS